ncbi:UvrD-helicase domain-containing protein [Citroniella saccharovorans]|uniref:DNA 3'-5' helicase n=1 Tax=Citroniella saccharovorans TaxID=2053367 RepID=A0AAW9MWW3_9FIRM|nr:UvrD-helicase domain-containing protein [Citroniella saccharovorans]MEB3428975.1 UvrD-helicase domain-containing protein [Citroniella saccharovorans]
MLDNLNEMQKKAVFETKGPILVLAGAGSGKTRVLTSKIYYLLKEKGVRKSEILAITFTNKAAKEMRERVESLLEEDVSGMWIGTFHSICVRILRRYADRLGYTSGFSIYDRTDSKTLLKEVYKRLDISDKTIEYNLVLNKISDAKNNLVFPEDYTKYYGNDFASIKISEIYGLYEDLKKEYNAFDFDDLIIKTLILLVSFDDALEYYQDKFSYIFVDEYQDTNKTQYELVKLLSKKHMNVTAVGDNDQSIYGWRGADISNILNFEKDFEASQVIKLERNYRSTSEILNAANELIKNNDQKYLKKLWTDKSSGKKPIYLNLPSDMDTAYKLVQKVNELLYKGEALSEMAILYRTNAESRQLEEALIAYGINYVVVGGLKFYERKEIKDIVAYLTIFMNKTDDVSFRRIINVPRRGIGEKEFRKGR